VEDNYSMFSVSLKSFVPGKVYVSPNHNIVFIKSRFTWKRLWSSNINLELRPQVQAVHWHPSRRGLCFWVTSYNMILPLRTRPISVHVLSKSRLSLANDFMNDVRERSGIESGHECVKRHHVTTWGFLFCFYKSSSRH
jgi:hypothetical protein